ncbi:ionotropic receptor 25a-like isoform X1 [Penaeus japonicus]|uniref:ionotropic receptor 25a-like isoform X1 n=1 Tax=Penaeus japonicus TaxID=27405 RepID=UPI001C70D2FF|nr:ionotropic receptor 25a-like isoform X1 [Penaeus japonicus]
MYWAMVLWCVVLLVMVPSSLAQMTIVSAVDESLREGAAWLEAGISQAEKASAVTLNHEVVTVSLDNEELGQGQLCSSIFNGAALLLDVTAGGWAYGRDTAAAHGIPYVRLQISNYQWMSAVDDLLQSRNATDAALIFGTEAQLDQALYYLVEGSVVRVIVLAGIMSNTTETLKKMRPAPSYYVILGSSKEISTLFDKAMQNDLVTRDSRWTLVATDYNPDVFDRQMLYGSTGVTVMAPTEQVCCVARKEVSACDCNALNIPQELTINAVKTLTATLKTDKRANVQGSCDTPPDAPPTTSSFYVALQQELVSWYNMMWMADKMQMTPQLEFAITAINSSTSVAVGTWATNSLLTLNPNYEHSPIRRFFRIGTVMARPWVYKKMGGGAEAYEGYCVELSKKLSELMTFDFEFVFPADGHYGARQKNGSWNGLVGDLANGNTDIIVAPLTMTSEREEVIDFVAPYFDQSGISIVIRKRQRQENLFKFMTVLKAEVWVSIVAALVVTGIMIWLLDKYSPYSAQNNASLYPPNCRIFTLKESFWFALTSFTPQGGGEAPKALSGRTLVAAYWLFVVLMLATFTANLAAFLTVERMQTPVSSLEELAGQSKINYTVLKSTATGQYFQNMAAAEEELYRVWKELTLNSTSDQSKYRVWDYPIKEQYTHILQVIEETGPVSRAQEGFQKVLDNEDGEFAFIHDASEIRYEVYHSCDLTEVGEPFAEQPYAIAVQQGSHLQDEISRAILELQKDRYFEALSAQFWNSSARGICPNDNDSEGITLQSLGGVFIATLIGLALAMIALAAEVMYYKRSPSKVTDITPKMALKMASEKDHVSRINVTPVY